MKYLIQAKQTVSNAKLQLINSWKFSKIWFFIKKILFIFDFTELWQLIYYCENFWAFI